jgi:hypothetical protein
MTGWHPSACTLLSLLPQTGRGPKRGGIFALWLTLRVAQDLLLDPPPLERAHRRRVQALEQRLSSLTMPPPLRRALAAAVSQLREGKPEIAALVLSQLVAPAREAGGAEAGDAIALAAREARRVVSGEGSRRASGEAGKQQTHKAGK